MFNAGIAADGARNDPLYHDQDKGVHQNQHTRPNCSLCRTKPLTTIQKKSRQTSMASGKHVLAMHKQQRRRLRATHVRTAFLRANQTQQLRRPRDTRNHQQKLEIITWPGREEMQAMKRPEATCSSRRGSSTRSVWRLASLRWTWPDLATGCMRIRNTRGKMAQERT